MLDDPIFNTKVFLDRASLIAIATAMTSWAWAQAAPPTPWMLAPSMSYARDKGQQDLFLQDGH
jgi:hypothetical protein